MINLIKFYVSHIEWSTMLFYFMVFNITFMIEDQNIIEYYIHTICSMIFLIIATALVLIAESYRLKR
jgi:hypothetical protein